MQRPSWFPNELAHAGGEHLDPAYVPGYDQKAGFDPAADVARLGDLGLDATHTLVDLGSGTGTLAVAVAPRCRAVVAVDVSPLMLAAVQAQAARRQLRNITCVQAGFLSYTHAGAPADVVYSRNALHHLPDFWKALALARVASMVRPDGVFVLRDLIFSCEPHELPAVVDAWLRNAPDDAAQGWTRSELEKHLRSEHSTFSWLLEPALMRAGFDLQDVHYDASRVYATYVCRRRR